MHENPTSLTFYPNKQKNFLLLLTSFLFTLGGIWMIDSGDILGWFVSFFFGICSVVFIAILLPNSSYLRISENGFEVRSLFSSDFTNWNEVGQFETGYIETTKMVVFNYRSEHQKYETSKKIAKNMTGFEGALPDTYGKSAEDLAKMLNEWKEKFLKK